MKKILLFLVIAISGKAIYAQEGFGYTLSYPIGFPMGNMHDYISQTSFRGISMEFNKRQKPNLDIGLELGWNTFYQREDSKVYTNESSSISGIQYRYTNIAPMLIGAKYYKVGGKATPYLGVGLGVMYVNRSTDFGLYRISTEVWPFTIRPELGVTFQLHPGLEGIVGAKYYAAFNTDDLDGQSFLSINIGLVFRH